MSLVKVDMKYILALRPESNQFNHAAGIANQLEGVSSIFPFSPTTALIESDLSAEELLPNVRTLFEDGVIGIFAITYPFSLNQRYNRVEGLDQIREALYRDEITVMREKLATRGI